MLARAQAAEPASGRVGRDCGGYAALFYDPGGFVMVGASRENSDLGSCGPAEDHAEQEQPR